MPNKKPPKQKTCYYCRIEYPDDYTPSPCDCYDECRRCRRVRGEHCGEFKICPNVTFEEMRDY